ncbi:MAG: F0F1 ATP synthase subunit epsilon [Tepidisphaeraceae bacterium]
MAFDGRIIQAIVPGHDGLVGILTHRAPLLVKLGIGPLRLDLSESKKALFLIDGGIAQMKGDRLTILTEAATPADAINYEAARAQYAEAHALKPIDPKTTARREHDLAVAKAKMNLVEQPR